MSAQLSISQVRKELDANVVYHIDGSNEIEFTWSKIPDQVRHTGIVLKLDGKNQFHVDFGAPADSGWARASNYSLGISQLSMKACPLAINSVINLRPYNHSENAVIIGTLLKLFLDGTFTKERAMRIVYALSKIKMGKYHALHNNCRAFVKRAVLEVFKREMEFTSKHYEMFQIEMINIETEDEQKISTAKTVAGVGSGAVVLSSIVALGMAFVKK